MPLHWDFSWCQNSCSGSFSSEDTGTSNCCHYFFADRIFFFLHFPIMLFYFFCIPPHPLPFLYGWDCREFWLGSFGFASIALCSSLGRFYMGLCSLMYKPVDGARRPMQLGIYLILTYFQKLSVVSGSVLILWMHSGLSSLLSYHRTDTMKDRARPAHLPTRPLTAGT